MVRSCCAPAANVELHAVQEAILTAFACCDEIHSISAFKPNQFVVHQMVIARRVLSRTNRLSGGMNGPEYSFLCVSHSQYITLIRMEQISFRWYHCRQKQSLRWQ